MSRRSSIVRKLSIFYFVLAIELGLLSVHGDAQSPPGTPPAVGVVRVERQQITESRRVHRPHPGGRAGRARRAGHRAFSKSGSSSKAPKSRRVTCSTDLEQPPFQAQVESSKATVEQLKAQHRNAELTLGARPGPAEQAGRPAVERRYGARRGTRAWRRKSPAPRRSCTSRRSISATPKSALRSTAGSAAPASPKATSSRRPAGPWRQSSARTRCT